MHDIHHSSLTQRKVPAVRSAAVTALRRLQNPDDPGNMDDETSVVGTYLRMLQFDTSKVCTVSVRPVLAFITWLNFTS